LAGFALTAVNTLLLHFKDDNNKLATMRFNIDVSETDPSGGAADAISTTAQAISLAALYETEIQIVAVNTDAVTFGDTPYGSSGDKVSLEFGNSEDGTITRMQVGTPLDTIFTDAWDVGPETGPMAAFLTAFLNHAQSETGQTLTFFRGGHRRRPPRLKRPF